MLAARLLDAPLRYDARRLRHAGARPSAARRPASSSAPPAWAWARARRGRVPGAGQDEAGAALPPGARPRRAGPLPRAPAARRDRRDLGGGLPLCAPAARGRCPPPTASPAGASAAQAPKSSLRRSTTGERQPRPGATPAAARARPATQARWASGSGASVAARSTSNASGVMTGNASRPAPSAAAHGAQVGARRAGAARRHEERRTDVHRRMQKGGEVGVARRLRHHQEGLAAHLVQRAAAEGGDPRAGPRQRRGRRGALPLAPRAWRLSREGCGR